MIISGVGRLGRDAELRYIPSGTAVCNLALAFNHGQKQPDGNRLSQWVECALWGKQAEALAQYLKKGNQVSITADGPHIEYYAKPDGSQQGKMVANIINIELIGGQNQQPSQQPAQQRPPHHRHDGTQGQQQPPPGNYDDQFSDDIPF